MNNKRLHLNEMQVTLPPSLFDGLNMDLVRYYPLEELEDRLKQEIGNYVGIDKENVFIYSGIDGLIELMYKAFRDNDFLIHQPSYYVYEHEALRQGISLKKEPLRDKNLSEEFFMLAQGKVCTVVNPNNPTGNLLLNADSAERLLDSCEYLVVDEAYYEFCGVTTVPLLRRYENLIVFRTFSKAFGLAGARIGYMIAHPTVIELFSKSCEVYRVSTPSMMLAQKALENKWYMVEYVGMVKKEMERLIKGLSAMGISAYPSEGNFILVEKGFGQFLTEYGYQVKTFDGFARMTVPAPPVTDEVLAIAENYGR